MRKPKIKKPILKKTKRILAVLLAVVMVNSVMDYSGILTAFAELEDNIAYQQAPVGAVETEAEASRDESVSAKADTLVSKVTSAFAPMTVYAAETESKDDTEDKTEQIMLYSTTHTYDTNGFCTDADCAHPYQPAELVSGTYEIANAGQLYWFAELVNTGTTDAEGNKVAQNLSANAKLTADITVNTGDVAGCNGTKAEGWRDWTPIGTSSSYYKGTFNGQNHTISGLYYNGTSEQHIGLVGTNDPNMEIKNVGVINFYFSNTADGRTYIGGICGGLYEGTISNCYSIGSIAGGAGGKGGIVGTLDGNSSAITNCYSSTVVQTTGSTGSTGGIAGDIADASKITNAYFDSGKCSKNAVGTTQGNPTLTNVGSFTTAQFASGEAAYTMNTNAGETIWYQTIGMDDYPVLDSTHKVVCQGQKEDGTKYYFNVSQNKITAVAGKTSKVYDATPFSISTDNGGNFSWNGSGTATIGGYYTKGEGETYTETTVEGSGATEVGGAPVNAGTYYVKLDVSADDDYMAVTAYVPITISQATGTVSNLSITGWTYGMYNQAVNTPTSESNSNATAEYKYKVKGTNDSTYTAVVPQAVGTYTLKGTYPATANYTVATMTTEFTIAKKTVTPSITGTAQKTYDGTTGVEKGDLTISLTGVISGDNSKVEATAAYAYASANKGTNITVTASKITLTGAAAGNYVLSKDTLTTTGTITAKKIDRCYGYRSAKNLLLYRKCHQTDSNGK